ncbi:ATP-binding protein [Paraglaciecola aestuariivivens]
MDQILQFFSNDYMPHGHCYLWLPSILWVNVISDLLIAIAYFSIPVLLIVVVNKRKDIKFKGIFLLFAAFILMCGISHLFAIYTVWNGSYGWHGISKLITAIVSVLTVWALFINREALVRIPTAYQLELALEEAKEANQAKRNFLACMSHEIRTPINGVMGMLNLTINNETDPEQAKKLSIAKKSAESLLAIINDIIDFSKVEAGKLEIEKVPFNISEMLADTVKGFSFCYHDKNVDLLLDAREVETDFIVGDPGRIRQILNNLISNAVKFTDAGEIKVVAKVNQANSGGYELSCQVQDTGIGIEKDKLGMLFNPFSQADTSTTRKYGGTGLGLAICNQLTQLMGGNLEVSSEPNKGSIFSFVIPVDLPLIEMQTQDKNSLASFYAQSDREHTVLLVTPSQSATDIYSGYLQKANYQVLSCESIEHLKALKTNQASAIQTIVIDAELLHAQNASELVDFKQQYPQINSIWILDYDSKKKFTSPHLEISGFIDKPLSPIELFKAMDQIELPALVKSSMNEGDKKPKYPLNVLIVEDNQINQTVVECLLEDCVASYQCANNGLEAMTTLKNSLKGNNQKFDLIFMDCQMPVMDGYEATQRIRAGDASEYYNDIAIIAMTANAMSSDRDQCIAAGMNDYISKPIAFDKVMDAIDKVHKKTNSS